MVMPYSWLLVLLLIKPLSSTAVQYRTEPLKLGVEIRGVYLLDHVNDTALLERIKEEVYKHRLVLFRNQGHIPGELLVALFSRFGDAFQTPWATQGPGLGNHERAPALPIMRISNDASEGYTGLGITGWHIDGGYKEVPFPFLVFNSIKAPAIAATKFVGHREVLGSMRQSVVRMLDRVWTAVTRVVSGQPITEIHPLIHTHPIVNESVLCFHLGYTTGIMYDYGSGSQTDLTFSQMLQFKQMLTHEIEKQEKRLVYYHKWSEGDLVIIDNWQVSHMAAKEAVLPKRKIGLRILHRLSINGVHRPKKSKETHFC